MLESFNITHNYVHVANQINKYINMYIYVHI